jgi:hypothetical protein
LFFIAKDNTFSFQDCFSVQALPIEVWAHSHRRWWRSEPMVTIDKCSKSTTTYRQGIYK